MDKQARERLSALREQVQKAHVWSEGQVYSLGGTKYTSTDTCEICGMTRVYGVDDQNGIPEHWTYRRHDGAEISLLDARTCAS